MQCEQWAFTLAQRQVPAWKYEFATKEPFVQGQFVQGARAFVE